MKNINIEDHKSLFEREDYKEMLQKKAEYYEDAHPTEKVNEILEWTKTKEYKELNFSRKSIVINPLKACQPLGALYAAIGLRDTMPYVHGSQGCAAYFRSHFSRHFREPFITVSDSMTEEAAVFGGLNNMIEGLMNAYQLYKPKAIAVCTSCMAEVIGDDLNSFIKKSKDSGSIPPDLPVIYANTPSFVGSHIVGYDNMLLNILSQIGKKDPSKKNDSINIIMGFDTYLEDFREIKNICESFDIKYNILSDPSDVLDSPTDGNYTLYRGGTPLEIIEDAPNAKATLILQKYSTTKTKSFIERQWEHPVKVVNPIGIDGADSLMMALSELSGKDIPKNLEAQRGIAIDAIADSYYNVYGKSFSLNADPDLAIGLTRFILELGGKINHILLTNGTKKWKREVEAILDEFGVKEDAEVYFKNDQWHFRSLLFDRPPDYIIGNAYAKFLSRDTSIPLIRIGFPLHDRCNLHRYTIIGYRGIINLLTWIVNTILEDEDYKTRNNQSYDVIK
ncbi:MAG: nitrogenase molybdenum-iron protein subunit beta [Deferribacterota bacterium]|nr:nitrogenase molybdenum-iron protein subunit beta [Deferribacterota bacterium]